MTVTRPLKIALVNTADRGNGAERCVTTLHLSLLEQGHHSRLFVGSKYSNLPETYEIPRLRPIPGVLRVTRWLENNWGVQTLYAPWFRNLDRMIGDVDVVNIHTLWGGQYTYSDLTGVRRLARHYPLVMTLHDGWMLTGHCACPINCNRWLNGCGRCPDLQRQPTIPRDATNLNWRRKRSAISKSPLHVTAVSDWLKSQVERSPIFAGKSVSVVHNSIDEQIFFPSSKSAAREHLRIPQDRFLVLLAGQTVEGIQQGIAQHALQAINQLNHPDLTALVVGRSSAIVSKTLNAPHIVFPFQESQEQMAQLYRAADLTIVTSEYETFGRVAAESQMCGTAVLSFATGGLTDVVRDPENGWLVPTGDTSKLIETLSQIIRSRDELTRRSESAASWSRDMFNTSRIAEQYISLYQGICRGPSDATLNATTQYSSKSPSNCAHSGVLIESPATRV